jgi:hypothetical protein
MRLLAVDPGTKAMGVALFDNSVLIAADTIEVPTGDRLERMEILLDKFVYVLQYYKPDRVVIEDPLLRGAGNATMERLKGSLEACCQVWLNWCSDATPPPFSMSRDLYYLGPTAVKKHMGDGDLSKQSMAAAALEIASTPAERELIQYCIDAEKWDSTDAICIGLVFLGRNKLEVW